MGMLARILSNIHSPYFLFIPDIAFAYALQRYLAFHR
jgi:hypothetical protein